MPAVYIEVPAQALTPEQIPPVGIDPADVVVDVDVPPALPLHALTENLV